MIPTVAWLWTSLTTWPGWTELSLVTIMQSNTDWDSVTVIRKSKPAAKDLKSASAINKALASGTAEITRKRTCTEFTNMLLN